MTDGGKLPKSDAAPAVAASILPHLLSLSLSLNFFLSVQLSFMNWNTYLCSSQLFLFSIGLLDLFRFSPDRSLGRFDL